ncbi:MAG TPA: hypothetical protein VMR86_06700 [Myxococcota bacterium]|nr:hypothetical protein [Myxococcota bacterium]
MVRYAFLSAAALLVAASPLHAHAGSTVVTAHSLSMTFKITSQGETNGGEDRVDRSTRKDKDLFDLCTGSSPTKNQGIFLFLNCTDPNMNEIDAISTQPLTGLANIGEITFGDPMVDSTKNGDLKTASFPVTIDLSCNTGALVATLHGIMDIKYSALSGGGQVCPESATVKITGSATSNNLGLPASFILDDGSLIKAKNRDGAIATLPPFP